MEDHVPRHAQMGAWVLINDRWYYSVPTRFGHCEVLVRGYVHEVVISCA